MKCKICDNHTPCVHIEYCEFHKPAPMSSGNFPPRVTECFSMGGLRIDFFVNDSPSFNSVQETDRGREYLSLQEHAATIQAKEAEHLKNKADIIDTMDECHKKEIQALEEKQRIAREALPKILAECERKIKVYDADGIGHSAHSFGATQALEHIKLFISEALQAIADTEEK